ncbi:NAD(P)/FAD-dependent oxidoreductase [Promicromonospora iranensis]|uniref:NADH dehydrogenase FAD-containing subunit n=1 Tax=Promicromonospora iranensis TaxID=1105144 RepID=A0ABU2CLV1_9MICO|nr:FAD-dependent oxidoreductase [Promicromonospora iranensis]MDR7382288.1 NADH dehydrogenase FAD-containing subunit [Promicromonospora iranensis]
MKHRIVVLGAGYAGASVAGRLARRLHADDVDVTVVNTEPDFVERVRMHQVAAGQELRHRPLRDILAGTGATLRVARVTAVDVERRTVSLAAAGGAGQAEGAAARADDTDELAYDTLVYALGSSAAAHGVPGVGEHAHDVASRPGALRLRDRLAELTPGGRVVVVGGGLTGIEAASEIAEARGDLEVALAVRGELGDWLSTAAQRHLRATFDRLGVTVHEHADVERVGAAEVLTGGGATVPADVTVWAAGFAVHPIATATSLQVSARGQIVVDGTMRSVSHPDVYAVGDAALADGPLGTPLRMSCASGIPMAWQAADSIAARLTGGKLPSTPLRYVHQCISLGRQDAVIQLVTADDRARPAAPGGRLAAGYKELVCQGAAFMVAHPLPYPVRRRRVTATAHATASL